MSRQSSPAPPPPPGSARPPAPSRLRRHLPFVASGLVAGLLISVLLPRVLSDAVVVVESTPEGATVLVDGQRVGTAPVRLVSHVWPLQRHVKLQLDGYRTWSGNAEAAPGETRHLTIALERATGGLAIGTSPPGATVVIDGRERGRTPLRVSDLPSGPRTVTLSLDGYQTWTDTVVVEDGQIRDLRRDLLPQPAPTPPSAASTQAERENVDAAAGQAMVDVSAPSAPIFPLAVMVENAPDARPQSGLQAADIVYEALAEGGISRFMAVYIEGSAPRVGPVRSTRHYFVNLAAELHAALVHVGSSPQGYEALRELGLPDLDETYGHPGFWRVRTRLAPHNAYTSVAGARQALEQRAPLAPGSWGPFLQRSEDTWPEGVAAMQIAIHYRPWAYTVEYRYDASSEQYARFMDGAPHLDADTGQQIQTPNLVILRVASWVIDTEGRLDMAQTGQGEAIFIQHGRAVTGRWSKAGAADPTELFDERGRPIRFAPGPVWVQIVPPEGEVLLG